MKSSKSLPGSLLSALVLIMQPLTVSAEVINDIWALCSDAFTGPVYPGSKTQASAEADGITHVEANKSESFTGGLHQFSGDVRMSKDDVYIRADKIQYQEGEERIDVSGNLYLERNNFSAQGDSAWFSSIRETGSITNSSYRIMDRHVRGSASSVDILGPDLFLLRDASYTTCPPESEAWKLNASSVELDYGENLGTAKHVWLNFMDVPVFYFPYLSFPVAGRKSGMLMPEFGSRTSLGDYLKVPFYWNIAPHRDATLTLNASSKRGLQYLGEFRFLNQGSEGELDMEYLARDKESHDERYFYAFNSSASTPLQGRLQVDLKDVSDNQYFFDFGDRFSSSLVNHLEQKISLKFQQSWFSTGGLIQEYKTIDETIGTVNQPYGKLPELWFSTHALDFAGWKYDLQASASYFYHPDNLSASRYRVVQSMGYPFEYPAGFIRPRLFHHSIFYEPAEGESVDDSTDLLAGGFSLASGLVFEREISLDQSNYLQTLEPELFYLYVPYENQDELLLNEQGIPQVFDTSLRTLSYANLFLENRFAGGDRLGDANQLALSLSSSFFSSSSGREVLDMSVGRLFYFEDRRVTLPGAFTDTRKESDLFGLLRYRPADYYSINSTVQWNTEIDKAVAAGLQLHYYPMRYNILNLGYLIARNGLGEVTQLDTDVSFVWKISPRINVVGRRSRSVLNQIDRELLYGLEYEDCCWIFRVMNRRYITSILAGADSGQEDFKEALMFQVVLKGLTSIGSGIDGVLSNDQYGIAGY